MNSVSSHQLENSVSQLEAEYNKIKMKLVKLKKKKSALKLKLKEEKKALELKASKNIKFQLPSELWSIVKEYAGVYHITTKWNKISSIEVHTLHHFYLEEFHRQVKGYTLKKAKELKQIIFKKIFKIGRMNKDKYEKLAYILKEKVRDFSKYKVGQEVRHTHFTSTYCFDENCGIITKVNKSSITYKPYKISHEVSANPTARENEEIETFYNYYDKNNFEKPINLKMNFYTKEDLISEPDFDEKELNQFDYFKTSCDWGWIH
jgi:hypothetical protein